MTAPAHTGGDRIRSLRRTWRRVLGVLGQSRIRLATRPRHPQPGDWIRIAEDTWRVIGDAATEDGRTVLVLEDVDADGRFARLAAATRAGQLALELADGRRCTVDLEDVFVYPAGADDDLEIGIPSPS